VVWSGGVVSKGFRKGDVMPVVDGLGVGVVDCVGVGVVDCLGVVVVDCVGVGVGGALHV